MEVAFLNTENFIIDFSPFTLTKTLGEIRVGILTLKEKWEKHLNREIKQEVCSPPIDFRFPPNKHEKERLFINPAVLPNKKLVKAINQLKPGEQLTQNTQLIAVYAKEPFGQKLATKTFEDNCTILESVLNILTIQTEQIEADFKLLTKNRKSKSLKDFKSCIYGSNYFIESGVKDKSAIINTENGPVYIGKNVTLAEFSVIQGPCAILDDSTILPHTHLRAGTTVGKNCAVGGEVKGSIISDYSNKAHYGYLGDSIIGSFCNLGAGTTVSNLKNNFGEINIPLYEEDVKLPSKRQKLGIIMGDYNCTAIQTSFFSGTYIGIANNIYGHNPKIKRVENFSWGDNQVYQLEKLYEFIHNFMSTKNLTPDSGQKRILEFWWNKGFLSTE